jgi:hypothetical protein
VDLEGADLERVLALHGPGADTARRGDRDVRLRTHRAGAGPTDVVISVDELRVLMSATREVSV